MGYLGIDNLYKNQEILMFKRCYAMEKIHGTSAHISFKCFKEVNLEQMPIGNYDIVNGSIVPRPLTEEQREKIYPTKTELHFFSGGEKHENFVKLFNQESLEEKFKALGAAEVVVFGEAYGGKQQGMSGTYGKELKFVAFEVKIDGCWLSVPHAESVCTQLGLEFVHYEEVPTDIEVLDRLAYADSMQAIRNGVGPGKIREGVVLRPLIELRKNNGERIIAKHKNDKFQETTKKREISKERLEVLDEANAIADDWVTEMRLSHILGESPELEDVTKTGDVIRAMIADILKESTGEIVYSKEARAAIGKRTAALLKARLKNNLH